MNLYKQIWKSFGCVANWFVPMINLVSLLSHVGKNTVYNFINSMIEESKCCSDVMKNNLRRSL